jgi:hypothetical protein
LKFLVAAGTLARVAVDDVSPAPDGNEPLPP